MIVTSLFVAGALFQPLTAAAGLSFNQIDHTKNTLRRLDNATIEAKLDTARQWSSKYAWASIDTAATPGDLGNFCGCNAADMFSQARVFRTKGAKPEIDFIPVKDSQTFTNKFSRKTSSSVSNAFSWHWSNAVTVDSSVTIGFAGNEAEFSVENTAEGGEERVKTTVDTVEVSLEHECAKGFQCQFWTFTFTAKYSGEYLDTPIIDFGKCLGEGAPAVNWNYTGGEGHHEITHKSKFALASLIGKSRKWDALAAKYYSVQDENGKAITETPPGGARGVGIQFPPDSVNVIPNVKASVKDSDATFPIYDGNTVYTALVTLEWRSKSQQKRDESEEEDIEARQEEELLFGGLNPDDIELRMYIS